MLVQLYTITYLGLANDNHGDANAVFTNSGVLVAWPGSVFGRYVVFVGCVLTLVGYVVFVGCVVTEPSNVISILISSEFLKMDTLVSVVMEGTGLLCRFPCSVRFGGPGFLL